MFVHRFMQSHMCHFVPLSFAIFEAIS